MSGDRRAPESAPAPFDAMGSARRSGWHLSREVQVSHLIATITVAVSCLWYVAKLEQRIALLEQQASVQESNHARLHARLHVRLDKIDEKLDRIIERYARPVSVGR